MYAKSMKETNVGNGNIPLFSRQTPDAVTIQASNSDAFAQYEVVKVTKTATGFTVNKLNDGSSMVSLPEMVGITAYPTDEQSQKIDVYVSGYFNVNAIVVNSNIMGTSAPKPADIEKKMNFISQIGLYFENVPTNPVQNN